MHGQFQALALRDGPLRVYLRAPLGDVKLRGFEVDENTVWVHFAMEGEWEGHPAGPFKFTSAIFSEIVENFRQQVNPVTMTYEHPSSYGEGQPIPAAGRILDLEVRDTGLWGLVRFTERAAEMVRAEEYAFTSVVVSFESADRETDESVGAELLQVGLVNDPFLDGQTPIKLSATEPQQPVSANNQSTSRPSPDREVLRMTVKPKLHDGRAGDAQPPAPGPAKQVELAEEKPSEGAVDGDSDADVAAMERLASLLTELSGQELPAVVAAIEGNPDAFAELLAAAPEEGTEADAGALAASAIADTYDATPASTAGPVTVVDGSSEIAALKAAVEALSGKVNSLEGDKAKAEQEAEAARQYARTAAVNDKVAELVKAGRILDASKDAFVKLGIEQPGSFDKLVESMAPIVPTGTIVRGKGPVETDVAQAADGEDVAHLTRQLKAAGIRDIDGAIERHLSRNQNRIGRL